MKEKQTYLTECNDGSFLIEEKDVLMYDIYFLLKDSCVIYIGCSSSINNRIQNHKANKDFDSYIIVDSYENKQVALNEERKLTLLFHNFSNCKLLNKSGAFDISRYRKIIKVK